MRMQRARQRTPSPTIRARARVGLHGAGCKRWPPLGYSSWSLAGLVAAPCQRVVAEEAHIKDLMPLTELVRQVVLVEVVLLVVPLPLVELVINQMIQIGQ